MSALPLSAENINISIMSEPKIYRKRLESLSTHPSIKEDQEK